MENIQWLLQGFQVALTFENIGAATLGAILGILVGAMPGIGSLAGVALLLPLTYKFDPTTAIIMLGALYYANMFGGAYSAILINIPGDGPAVMTTLDGYPLAQKGRPGTALLVANTASFIGGLIGMIILTFTGPALARLGLNFGPVEMAALMILAMTSIGWLMGDSVIKGLVSTALGIIIACIGMDSVTGIPRYSFGNIYLLGGIPFTPLVIGMVGFSKVIGMMKDRNKTTELNMKLSFKESLLTRSDFKRLLPPAIRSGVLGTFIGVLPGAGATTGAFAGYAMQKKFKSKEPLGTGAIEGLASCESGNNAAAAGAFAPLLALGIPGSGTGAVLLGGLMMWGLTPGPLLFTEQPEFTWGLIASLFLANGLTLLVAICIIPFLVKILVIPTRLMIPIITTICIVGSYSATNSLYGVIIMFIAGCIGYIMNECDYPSAPLILAIVLSKIFETNLRRAFIISGGSPLIFFTEPISLFFMCVLILLIVLTTRKKLMNKN
ncbi:tricarboxylate transporter [Candidatus Epulonipiscium fishelsonii]|uniref:Tricarboxylate transporter n=1 Tax=Candidatus Epulonipiscium fishelsonii TaxID=77094 RepID=A0ACC8XJ55_9FIRM|nr:tricarboxylate transporter [Epulopiscium sp. SCG-D08WGA-EpuloA1]